MASKSRPSRLAAARHAATADLVVEAPTALVQSDSDRHLPRGSVGDVIAVAGQSSSTWTMVKRLKSALGKTALCRMAWRWAECRTGRTRTDQRSLDMVGQEFVLELTRMARQQSLAMALRRPASTASGFLFHGLESTSLVFKPIIYKVLFSMVNVALMIIFYGEEDTIST